MKNSVPKLLCPWNVKHKQSKIMLKEHKSRKKRLSPNFQDTDVIVLAVILFQLAQVLWTKYVIKPLPLMFFYSNHAFYERCISTTETIFHCSGWHGTPAVHALHRTPLQHKDFSFSHCCGVKNNERQTLIVITKLTSFSFHISVTLSRPHFCLFLSFFGYSKPHIKKPRHDDFSEPT